MSERITNHRGDPRYFVGKYFMTRHGKRAYIEDYTPSAPNWAKVFKGYVEYTGTRTSVTWQFPRGDAGLNGDHTFHAKEYGKGISNNDLISFWNVVRSGTPAY